MKIHIVNLHISQDGDDDVVCMRCFKKLSDASDYILEKQKEKISKGYEKIGNNLYKKGSIYISYNVQINDLF